VWVVRGANEEFDDDKIASSISDDSVRVHVWGCFAGGGVGDIYFYEEPLTADKMKAIYKQCLWSSARGLFGVDADWWLLYDNDPRHKAQVTVQWLNDNFVHRRIDFPPYSPDLNPIENLWPDLVARVDAHHPKTREDLENAIRTEWTKTSTSLLRRLADSMPKRLQELIEHKGHKTHY
jgi:hypothetical protein